MVSSLLSVVLRNSVRNQRRTVLTAASIAASFCVLGVILATYELLFLSPATPDQALRLVVRNGISFANPLPASYAEKIRKVRGVREVMVQQWFGGTYRDARSSDNNFARFAIEPQKLFIMHPDYRIADNEQRLFFERQDSCILALPLARRLGIQTGDRITLVGNIFNTTLNLWVAGFYESATDTDALYFHNRYLNGSLHDKRDMAVMFLVLVGGPESVAPVSREIDALFRNANVETRTETEKSFRVSFLHYLGNLKTFLFLSGVLLALTMLLVSANSICLSIRERTIEVGILKAIGFTPNTIVWLIAAESALVAVMGGAMGWILAQVLVSVCRGLPVMMMNLAHLDLPLPMGAAAIVLAGLCGLLAALPPAWGAARRATVQCLRHCD